MRILTISLLSLLVLSTTILPTTYKLTHPNQVPWPGFFSVFNTVLGALDFYENSPNAQGLIVDFEKLGLFYDPKHGENWWEYYFEPINLGTQDTETVTFKNYKKITFSFFAQLKMSRQRSNELIKKYIKLKPHIQNKLATFIKNNFENSQVIGIHYRGTDKLIEAHLVNFETIGKLLEKEVESNKAIKIFVATDDENFLMYMYKTFPGKIIALNAIRSKDGNAIHTNTNEDPYKKGEEALLDCLLLSCCSKLYKTASNLSDVSIKFNPTMPVINISSHFVESKRYGKYNFFKVFESIVVLLDIFETNPNLGFTANIPTKDDNWWEYHFNALAVGEPHPNLELSDVDLTILSFNGVYEMDPQRAHQLINKYIQIKPHVIEKVTAIHNEKIKKTPCISVFYIKEKENDYQQFNEIILKTNAFLGNAPENTKILLISNDATFISLMTKTFSNIITPSKPNFKFQDGELELYLCLLMASTDAVIGSKSIHLKVVSHLNPLLPIIEVGEYWLEQ